MTTSTYSRIGRTAFAKWTSTLAAITVALTFPASADVDSRAGLQLIAEGMTAPVDMEELPDGSGRLLVADQAGIIHLINKNGEGSPQTFLDLRDRMVTLREGFDERGLLAIALHPDFQENRRLFVYYSAPLQTGGSEGFDHTSHISEFRVNEDSSTADPASERIILQQDQPQFNHNGGSTVFGPDGYLYISFGDGGGGGDVGLGHHPELGNGQDINTLLGSIVRIDVDGDGPYSVPDDNPFVGQEGRDEIFAYGLRNTWGLSFDLTGDQKLYGADVGQLLFEEVNILEIGKNYGWSIREGFHCFDSNAPRNPPEDCPNEGPRGEPLQDPIIEYKNANGFRNDPEALGVCVIGGHRYRGSALPHLEGRYIFGDWSKQWGQPTGVLLIATPPADDLHERWEVESFRPSTHSGENIGSFLLAIGRDADEELYILTSQQQGPRGETGRIYKLVAQE